MKKIIIAIYVALGTAWSGYIFYEPLCKNYKNVGVISAALVQLALWPVYLGIWGYNTFVKKEATSEKNNDN